MNPNGTAEYHDYGDLEYVFKYTWDATKQEIYMVVEKIPYDDGTLLNYNQLLSKLTYEEYKKETYNWYIENKDKDWFEEDYPNCKNYDNYVNLLLEETDCKNLEELFKLEREYYLEYLNTIFGAKMTYGYDFDEDDKMILTEKFTGMKNFLLYEICSYDKDGTSVDIQFSKGVSIRRSVNGEREYWDGEFGNGRSITFEKEDSEETKTGSYTEDIANETVTVNFDGEKYVCKFEGRNFIED